MSVPAIPDVESLKSSYARVTGRRDGLQKRLREVEAEILQLVEDEATLERVEALFHTLIDAEIKDAVVTLETLLSEALRAVFSDQDLSVRSDVSIERGKVSVSVVTVQNHGGVVIEGDTTESFGNSVTTVESILLRVLILLRRGMRPFLVLDEAFPAFDPNYAGNMGRFLSFLCQKLGVYILAITHHPLVFESADRAYKVSRKDGSAHFELVEDLD